MFNQVKKSKSVQIHEEIEGFALYYDCGDHNTHDKTTTVLKINVYQSITSVIIL